MNIATQLVRENLSQYELLKRKAKLYEAKEWDNGFGEIFYTFTDGSCYSLREHDQQVRVV